MTQEEKDLLLKSICEISAYGKLIVNYKNNKCTVDAIAPNDYKVDLLDEDGFHIEDIYVNIDCIKPYLRPISSMTEEERVEMGLAIKKDYINPDGEIKTSGADNLLLCSCRLGWNFIDWLNAHHFDYRGLIEKGLALEAPEGMYNNIK